MVLCSIENEIILHKLGRSEVSVHRITMVNSRNFTKALKSSYFVWDLFFKRSYCIMNFEGKNTERNPQTFYEFSK